MLVLLFASAAIYITVLMIYANSKFASVYHPISFYLLFHGFVFVVRPFFAYLESYRNIYWAFRFTPSADTKVIVIVVANIGLLAFVAGAWRTGKTVLTFRQGPEDLAERKRLIAPFLLVLALLTPLAISSVLGIYAGAGGTMRLDRSAGISINTTANGWFLEAQIMLVPLSVLTAWIFRFRWWSLLPLAAFVLVRAGTGGKWVRLGRR